MEILKKLVSIFLAARGKVDAIKSDLAKAQEQLDVAKSNLISCPEFTEKTVVVD